MSISLNQTPALVSLAQSPIIFTVAESNTNLLTSSSFQFVGDLYYWTGSLSNSGSSQYTIVKYPNTSNVGIFDLNRIINSTLTDLAIANTSNVKYYAVELAKFNITCNAISPAGVYNNHEKKFISNIKKLIPMNRMANKHDIKNTIDFLINKKQKFITGQNIVIDGGRTIL